MPGVSTSRIWLCALDRDAHQPDAGGLRLGADDRDLLADQRVDERGLAGVGRADDGDEAAPFGGGFGHGFNSLRRVRAASVSASCFDVPVPSAVARPGISTVTVKVGAWCGPDRREIS